MEQEAAFFYEDLVSADVQEDIDGIPIQDRFETYAKAAQATGEALVTGSTAPQPSSKSLSAALLQLP